ncbi:MAG: hypothetical protein GWN62_05775 [Aliifodinibius sp.]|nr:hypothetical protein [Fodinibius sp.]
MDTESLLKNKLAESKRIADAASTFFRRRFILWAIRWTIGFGVIAVVIYYLPNWLWLWYTGVAIAGLSLVSMIAGRFMIQRKVANINKSIEDARIASDDLDAESEEA